MRIVITFPRGADSRALYDDLSCFKMSVTDIGTAVCVHRDGITATEISQVLGVCDKHGCYEVSVTK